MLARVEWQATLFAENLSRLGLLRLQPAWPLNPLTVQIHRNHGFELVAIASAWLAWWKREVRFIYSAYDDSLSFNVLDDSADVHVVWVDLQHYGAAADAPEFADWLGERLHFLRNKTRQPILFAGLGMTKQTRTLVAERTAGLPGFRLADLHAMTEVLGPRMFDERKAAFTGTRLSETACLACARELACHWLPALLAPRIKAVVLDADHTLYEGVLAEDGLKVKLTPGHKLFQETLVQLRESGVFLAVVSHNEARDLQQLFESRPDFPLRWEHFSAAAVNWEAKSLGLRQVAETLRIGMDALLFVDDNVGELAHAVADIPSLTVLHAQADAFLTQRALAFYPALWTWGKSATDNLRTADLAAEDERARIQQQYTDPRDYLRSLHVRIGLGRARTADIPRLHELSQKTNQFNLNLSRFSEIEVADLAQGPASRVIALTLKDRLADSGMIGLAAGKLEGQTLVIVELAISCRALGRRLEDLMVSEAIRMMRTDLPAEHVVVAHRTGPRNTPARDWLARVSGQTLPPEGRVAIDALLCQSCCEKESITLEEITHG